MFQIPDGYAQTLNIDINYAQSSFSGFSSFFKLVPITAHVQPMRRNLLRNLVRCNVDELNFLITFLKRREGLPIYFFFKSHLVTSGAGFLVSPIFILFFKGSSIPCRVLTVTATLRIVILRRYLVVAKFSSVTFPNAAGTL